MTGNSDVRSPPTGGRTRPADTPASGSTPPRTWRPTPPSRLRPEAPLQAGPHGDPLTDPLPGAAAAAAAGARRPAVADPRTAVRAAGVPARSTGQASDRARPEVRRFMTATDFLDRRADQVEPGRPRGAGAAGSALDERAVSARGWAGRARARAAALHPARLRRPRTIAFLNPKGGAAKTTGVLAAGYTFGTVRGGGVVAWDNNETRGTLGIRGTRSAHRNTTRELLEDLGRFSDVYQARIGDLGAFVRSQGDAHFDVLASDERPDVTGMIRAEDFTAVHQLLERFYRVILIDTGNNMRAENWLAAARPPTCSWSPARSARTPATAGCGCSTRCRTPATRTSSTRPSRCCPTRPPRRPTARHDLVQVYGSGTKAVYRVPYDPVLVAGSRAALRPALRGRARVLAACAGMASLSRGKVGRIPAEWRALVVAAP